MNKHTFVNKILSQKSDKIACINHLDQSLRYSELYQMVNDIELFFDENRGLKHKRYGFLTEDAFSLFPIVLGCLENIVLVPLDSQIPIEQFKEVCEQYRLSGLITPNRTHPFYIEANNRNLSLIFYALNQSIQISLDKVNPKELELEKDLAFVINTTGTTNQAKRILIDSKAYMRQVIHEAEYYHFDSNIIHIISTKPSRYVSTFIGFRVLYAKGTLCISTTYQARILLDWIRKFKNVNISMTPSGLLPLLEESKRQGYKHTDGLIQIFLSGSSVTQSLCDHFEEHFNVRFIYNYGSSETGALSSTYFSDEIIPSSVGILMIDKSSIRIESDEIQIKTENLFKGYEGLDKSEYMIDAWFKTGDSGTIDDKGNLFILGRIKEIINRGGDKISPFELERKLSLHDSILDCVVFPVENDKGYDDIACAIVIKDGYSFDIKTCREYLQKWFIPFHCPSILIEVKQIPSNEHGKIQRYRLQEIFKDDIRRLMDHTIMNTEENLILKLASYHLKLSSLKLEDNFFDIGGDSLKASELISHLEHEFNRKIDLTEFLKNPILLNLGKFEKEERIFTKCLKADGHKPALICLHSGDGDAFNYRTIAQDIKDRPVYAIQYKQNEADLYEFNYLEDMVNAYITDQVGIKGPYHVLGDCLGGGIAYEYARQSIEKGKAVGMLMMLDTPRKGIRMTKKSFINRFLLKVTRNLKNLSLNPIISIRRLMSAYKKMFEWLESRNYPNHFRKRILELYKAYNPPMYSQSIVYIQAIKEFNEEDQNYWRNKATGFELIKMNCRHGEFLSQKYSKELVTHLEKEMSKYE